MRFVLLLTLLIGACATPPPAVVGWQDPDAHLVDGRWIGAEAPCETGDGGLECRTVVERAIAALSPDVRSEVTRATLVELPTTFVTATGETRTARLAAGVDTRKAVVIDFTGGTRRVIGLWCYLPYVGSGLKVSMVGCTTDPLDYWRDGNAPPSYPPGTKFG
jgi:hypothetical protein